MTTPLRSRGPERKREWDHEALLLIILFLLITVFGPVVN